MSRLLSILVFSLFLSCLFIKLPSFIVDFAIILNIFLTILLLYQTVCLDDLKDLVIFPNFILFLTIFRLSINISTTRLILNMSDPGEIIELSSRLLISDNLFAGFIIFIIFILIQYIVVSKGSERVAEVSARFKLDALPGKQMSIDNDLRSGLLTPNIAREKRNDLLVQSHFFASLDGAVKFVKGDAIVSLIIIFINIFGGIISGIFIYNLEFTDVSRKIISFTIGDGLISQIPSLLNSITAAFIVTKSDNSLFSYSIKDLFYIQILKSPIFLIIFSGLIFIFFTFLNQSIFSAGILLVLFIIIIIYEFKKIKKTNLEKFIPNFNTTPYLIINNENFLKNNDFKINLLLEKIRANTFNNLGVIIPEINIKINKNQSFLVSYYKSNKLIYSSQENDLEIIFNDLYLKINESILSYLDHNHTQSLLNLLIDTDQVFINDILDDPKQLNKITKIIYELYKESFIINDYTKFISLLKDCFLIDLDIVQTVEKLRIELKTNTYLTKKDTVYKLNIELTNYFNSFFNKDFVFSKETIELIIDKLKVFSDPIILADQNIRRVVFETLSLYIDDLKVIGSNEIYEKDFNIKIFEFNFNK